MTTDWVYPVNERSDSWGYERTDRTTLSVLDLMSDRTLLKDRHEWTLSRKLKEFQSGDLIWVRAAQPIGGFVGCGRVVDDPEWRSDGYYFGVRWDVDLCVKMARNPFDVLTQRAQTVRHFKPGELRNLNRRVARLRTATGWE